MWFLYQLASVLLNIVPLHHPVVGQDFQFGLLLYLDFADPKNMINDRVSKYSLLLKSKVIAKHQLKFHKSS